MGLIKAGTMGSTIPWIGLPVGIQRRSLAEYGIRLFQLPYCGWDVTSCLAFLSPCLPHDGGLNLHAVS